jgi:hypothetical protein
MQRHGGRDRCRLAAVWLAVLICLSGSVQAQPTETREERMIAPGVKYTRIRREQGPQEIRVIEIERLAGYIRALPALAAERGQALAPLSEIAARVSTDSAYSVAAVNGDYFIMEPGPTQGDPLGIAVVDGEVVSTPFPRSALVIDREGRAGVQLLRLDAWVSRAGGFRHPLHAVNEARGADRMILYTPRYGESTRANGSGTEVTLGDVSLPVRAGATASAVVRAVRRRAGNTPIPADGLVLSGHGAAAAFLEGLVPGDTLTLRLEFSPPLPEGAHVLGGGPQLLRAGRVVWQESAREEQFSESLTKSRHPRTAAGIAGARLLLVTVDGRQPGVSEGMDLAELSALMRESGCTEAINLDGGGSTTLWVRGAVENRPSSGRERKIANALVVFSSAPKGPPARLIVTPREVALLAGASVPLSLTAEDEHYNPAPLPPGETAWEIDATLGAVDGEGRLVVPTPPALLPTGGGGVLLTAATSATRSGLLSVTRGGLRATAPVTVYDRPPRLEVGPALAAPSGSRPHPPAPSPNAGRGGADPASALFPPLPALGEGGQGGEGGLAVRLTPNSVQSFSARAFDETGRPLAIPPGAVGWECDPAVGMIDAAGRLTASMGPARGQVAAMLLGVRGAIEVTVGSVDRLIDGFETPGNRRVTTYPSEVVGSVALTEERPRGGARALALAYDFTRGTGSRAVYAVIEWSLGAPLALRVWARGDGGGAWMRARLRDAGGVTHTLDFARSLGTLSDWQEFRAVVPPAAVPPLALECVYLVETRRDARPRGRIVLDDLVGEYAPE